MQIKKNILLTTSAAPDQSPFSTSEKRPPLGIGFLISVLRNAGHNVFFIDNYLRPTNFLERNFLQKNNINYIGIYANTICFRDTLKMLYKIEYLRKINKWNGEIFVGGPHTSVCPETIPKFVDYIVQGEGEQAVLDIVEGKVNKGIVKYPRIKNLDELPSPAWDYFINLPYNWSGDWWSKEQPVFTMNTSRGCPFNCSFCSVKSIWGKEYTYFSAERIIDDIIYLIKKYGAKGIYFREDNFTLNKKRLEKFCDLIFKKNIKISWACESRIDTLTEDLIKIMKKAGLKGLYLGIESGSQKILNFLKKGITVEQIKNAFNILNKHNIKTAASIIVGTPNENLEDIQQTLNLIKEIKPTIVWYNVFVGIPDSELYRYTIKNKLYEFIDDRGLVYLKGHNSRVKFWYSNLWDAKIPLNLNSPEVSVVMPVHNDEKYLSEAIQSILKQTYNNFEFIIIDDASTDNSFEIMKQFDDPRIKILRNPKKLGIAKSLNKAIEIAKGKYIARMDADDISLPHRIEKQLEFLTKYNYSLIGSYFYKIDEDGNIIQLVKVFTSDKYLKQNLLKQNWFCHGSVMFKKESFWELGGYDIRYKYAQDYDLWLKFSENYKIGNVPEPLYCWRENINSISSRKKEEQMYFAIMAIQESKKRQPCYI